PALVDTPDNDTETELKEPAPAFHAADVEVAQIVHLCIQHVSLPPSGSASLFCARVLRARFHFLSERAFPHRTPCSSQQTFLTNTKQIKNPGSKVIDLPNSKQSRPGHRYRSCRTGSRRPSDSDTDTELEEPAPAFHAADAKV
ncbi:unnamed protein product, partial [Ectocarpus sp. 12 AP-2014]